MAYLLGLNLNTAKFPEDTPVTKIVSLLKASIYPLKLGVSLRIPPLLVPPAAYNLIHARVAVIHMTESVKLMLIFMRGYMMVEVSGVTHLGEVELK